MSNASLFLLLCSTHSYASPKAWGSFGCQSQFALKICNIKYIVISRRTVDLLLCEDLSGVGRDEEQFGEAQWRLRNNYLLSGIEIWISSFRPGWTRYFIFWKWQTFSLHMFFKLCLLISPNSLRWDLGAFTLGWGHGWTDEWFWVHYNYVMSSSFSVIHGFDTLGSLAQTIFLDCI